MKSFISFLLIYLSLHLSILSQVSSKQGGICFRVDDNKPMDMYFEYAEKFNMYGFKFCFALNLARSEFDSPEYVSKAKQLQSEGHELMDHTPNHRTSSFVTKFNPSSYSNLDGVDHIIGSKICLEYDEIDLNRSSSNGYVDIAVDRITSSSNEFNDFSYTERYLYFPELPEPNLVIVKKIVNDGTIDIWDAWMNNVNLGYKSNVRYYSFRVSKVRLTNDAMNLLINETRKLADHFEIERPVTWIQPGVSSPYFFPYVYMKDLRLSAGDNYDYVAGAVYPYSYEKTYKVYNEYDPYEEKQFGMQWGDFNVDSELLEKNKTDIADGIAKHSILIGSSHFTGLLGGWDAYIVRVDSVLAWCKSKDIMVKTYRDWSNILYKQTQNPYVNIFPHLYTNLDENDRPDGYTTKNGLWSATDGVESSNNCCYRISSVNKILEIKNLGGIEKGKNHFEIWTKGNSGGEVEVIFEIGDEEKIFNFPADNNEWTLYTLKQSTNGNNELIIPENISLIDITIKCSKLSSGTVKVSGMSLRKNDVQLSVKVFLEGAYSNNGFMNNTINSHIPLTQPYSSSPWNYTGHETITESINSNIVDWVLITIKQEVDSQSYLIRKAALLKDDGYIVDLNGLDPVGLNLVPGEYFIQVEHRNHLKIISTNKVLIN